MVLACFGAACTAGESNTGEAIAVRDSAGVQIVEHPESAWSSEASWRVGSEPVLAIGLVEGPPEYLFSGITGALRLGNGTIAVADGRSAEIRFFDAKGAHVRSVGGRGAGPGEYRYPWLMTRFGADSLLVWDGGLDRGSVLGIDGGFGRTVPRPAFDGGFVSIRGALEDGSLLGSYDAGHHPSEERPGMKRHKSIFYRLLPPSHIDTIGEFFAGETYIEGNASYAAPFSRQAVTAASGKYFHYGASDTYEIRTYTAAGDLARIIRSPRAFPLTRQDIDAVLAKVSRPELRQTYARMPFPETLPAYGEFRTDAEDNLWVADYLGPGQEEQKWTIFGADGSLAGTLITPPRFRILDIGSDFILGSARDELDVERAVLYDLIKQSEL